MPAKRTYQRLTSRLAAELNERIAVLADRVDRIERELADERDRSRLAFALVRGRVAAELQVLKDAGAAGPERQVAA